MYNNLTRGGIVDCVGHLHVSTLYSISICIVLNISLYFKGYTRAFYKLFKNNYSHKNELENWLKL